MRRRSRAGGESIEARRLKTIARKAMCSRSSTTANLETELAQLIRERNEAREHQAATADVLKVISRSSFELETVLDTLVETAARLCRADQATLFRQRGDMYHLVASRGWSEDAKAFVRTYPLFPDPRHADRPRKHGTSRGPHPRRPTGPGIHPPRVTEDPRLPLDARCSADDNTGHPS